MCGPQCKAVVYREPNDRSTTSIPPTGKHQKLLMRHATMTMTPLRLCCFVLVVTALPSLVIGFSISHKTLPKQRIRLASSEDCDYEEAPSSISSRNRPGRIRPKRQAAVTAQANAREAQAHERHQQALQDPSLLSNQVFAERTDLHPATRRALTETMGLTFMTEIQSKTYAAASSGQSILASAKTGTGKTLAFLIPALERVLQGTDRSLYVPGRNIAILVLAPTRELSIQIANQARLLLTFHSKDLSVMDMYGGTKMARDLALLNKRIPTILVATPGKLLEHITSTRVGGGGRRRFSDIISQTRIVVLDETDRLLDSGFQRYVCKILSHLPRREKRQTLLFSATMPKRIKSAMKDVLSLNYTEIHVDNQDNENKTGDNLINTRVKQSYFMLTSMDNYVVTLLNLVMNAMQSTDKFKILVFFPATKLVRFFAQVCNHVGLEVPVRELHSRMSQSARQRASSDFSSSSRAVLFTSDVSARGVDYPDITHVIQYGSADNKVTYTHRIGRTGRAGRSGEGILVLLPFERKLLGGLRQSGVEENNKLVDKSLGEAREMLQPVRNRIQSGNIKLMSSAEGAYRAFLAYYMSRADRLGVYSAEHIVQSANDFAASVGLSKLPSLSEKTAKKLNLKGVNGVSIDNDIELM